MLPYSVLLALAAVLYSTPSTAISYSMISTKDIIEDPKDAPPKTYVETRPIGCTLMTDTPITPTNPTANIRDQGSWAGMSMHQDTWSPEATWIGFWARRECNRNLPSLVIHWYPQGATDQVFDVRRLLEYLPRMSEGDYRYMSWGEMTIVPQEIIDNVAPGAVAIREKKPSRVLGSEDQAWYRVYEDVVKIKTNPSDPMEDDLAGYSTRGQGRAGKQLHLTFRNEEFTRTINGPGGEYYPIPSDQLQNVDEMVEEQPAELDEIGEELPPALDQQAGMASNSPIESGSVVESSQRSSPGIFPDATVLINVEMERSPQIDQGGGMEEEVYNAPDATDTQAGPGNAFEPAGENTVETQLQEILQQEADLSQPSITVDTVLQTIGIPMADVARSIELTGPSNAEWSVLNRIALQRLQIEMNGLTQVEAIELAGHQISQWGPFSLANALGEVRIRREAGAGTLTPEAVEDLRARTINVAATEVEVARKVIRDVIARTAPAGQTQTRIQPWPEFENTQSDNELLANVAPINSANSLVESLGLDNNAPSQNGRLPGGGIEIEEEGGEGEDSDDVWRSIVVHGPVSEEIEEIQTLNPGQIISNMRTRVGQFRPGDGPPSSSSSEAEPALSSETESSSEKPTSDSSPYAPQDWEGRSPGLSSPRGSIQDQEESLADASDTTEEEEEEEYFQSTSQEESGTEEFEPYFTRSSAHNAAPVRGNRRGRPRRNARGRGQGK
ncbi:hypothetical protein TWF481_008741 [Arthrobotrys musiformis]|uniref:Enterotoxin n=1 Tax=Arthrobotrys musiformis TaxID=47236 RepID=A0AAV9WA21_9PEZI